VPRLMLRAYVIGLFFSVFLAATIALAADNPSVAVIMSRSIPPYREALDGFKKALPSRIKVFEVQKEKSFTQVAEEVKAEKPDLILAIGSSALKLAIDNFKKTPVVFSMVLSVPKLPANVCGVSMMLPAEEHLKGLKLVAPSTKTIGIVYNPKNSGKRANEFKTAAGKLGMKVAAIAIKSKKEAFSSIKLLGERVDAIWMIMDKDVVANFGLMLTLSVQQKIPFATFSYRYVEKGALLALCPNFFSLGHQAGELAAKIQGGVSPSKFGIAFPDSFYYSYNVKTGVKIQLGIPQAILKKEHKLYGN
jgi:putative tryptophan/tyrosine transport system substrate-binding protein